MAPKPEDFEADIDERAAALGLTIRPEWKPNIATFLDVARTMAARVEETRAAAAGEAAPVFTPRALTPHVAE